MSQTHSTLILGPVEERYKQGGYDNEKWKKLPRDYSRSAERCIKSMTAKKKLMTSEILDQMELRRIEKKMH